MINADGLLRLYATGEDSDSWLVVDPKRMEIRSPSERARIFNEVTKKIQIPLPDNTFTNAATGNTKILLF